MKITITGRFIGLLQITFIVLKLCKVIDWKWILVLLPTLIPVGITFTVLVAMLISMYLKI